MNFCEAVKRLRMQCRVELQDNKKPQTLNCITTSIIHVSLSIKTFLMLFYRFVFLCYNL